MTRQFESHICEQIWIARKTPPHFIKNLRDRDGYLCFEDLTFPIELLMDQRKKLSLSDCMAEPMPRLLWGPMFEEEERILAVAKWSGGNGPYAQVGILKYPENALQDYTVGSLIKRNHEGHVYYLGRFFDLLTAMFDAGLLPSWEEEYGDTDEIGNRDRYKSANEDMMRLLEYLRDLDLPDNDRDKPSNVYDDITALWRRVFGDPEEWERKHAEQQAAGAVGESVESRLARERLEYVSKHLFR